MRVRRELLRCRLGLIELTGRDLAAQLRQLSLERGHFLAYEERGDHEPDEAYEQKQTRRPQEGAADPLSFGPAFQQSHAFRRRPIHSNPTPPMRSRPPMMLTVLAAKPVKASPPVSVAAAFVPLDGVGVGVGAVVGAV